MLAWLDPVRDTVPRHLRPLGDLWETSVRTSAKTSLETIPASWLSRWQECGQELGSSTLAGVGGQLAPLRTRTPVPPVPTPLGTHLPRYHLATTPPPARAWLPAPPCPHPSWPVLTRATRTRTPNDLTWGPLCTVFWKPSWQEWPVQSIIALVSKLFWPDCTDASL